MFELLSMKPEVGQVIRPYLALAPVSVSFFFKLIKWCFLQYVPGFFIFCEKEAVI